MPVLKWALVTDGDLRAHVELFARDDAAFKAAFASAWTKLMNADRFDGPTANVCDAPGATVPMP